MALYEVLADGTIVPKAGKTVGNLDCLRTELLWINPSPLNEFVSQTLELDLTDYDYVMIYATLDNAIAYADRTKVTSMAKVGTTKNLIFGARTADYIRGLRDYDVTETGIYFGTSNLIHNNGTTGLNNTWCTPLEIYGIKKTPAMIYTGKELFAGNGISIDDGVVSSKGLEYVGYYSADGNVSVDIDLDKYDYFAYVRINTNSSTDVNLGIFPNTSFNVYTAGKPNSEVFNYCYLHWARTFSTSIYITYNQNNDGYLRVYPSNYQLTFASSQSKPTTLTTYSNGTVTIANIILYRRKK